MADLTIIYDGECPFCKAFVRLVRLRESVGSVVLIDARSDDPRVKETIRAGYDLNTGMVVRWQDRVFHGADAMHLLAILSNETAAFGGMQRAFFGSPNRAAWFYMCLTRARTIVLALLRRKPINSD